jgi:parallel beta helix pectate lyase-like protein
MRTRLALTMLVAGAVWCLSAGVASAATWHVHPGESIQVAVNNAHPGDTIRLAAGVYRQNVTIRKNQITLVGAGRGPHGSRIVLSSQPTPSVCNSPGSVNGICILGQIDQNFNPMTPVRGTTVKRLSVRGFTGFGVFMFNAADTMVTQVTARRNSGYGISGFVLSGITFTRSVARDNGEPGFYIGDSPHANAWVVGNKAFHNGVGGEGIGMLFRDSSFGHVAHNTSFGNCVGMLFIDTGEPGGEAHWHAAHNQANRNNGACPGETNGPPPLSGLGIGFIGVQDSVLRHNWTFRNHPAGPSAWSGGIVVATAAPAGGADPMANLLKGNRARNNGPFDIAYDGSGSGNMFVNNRCGTSSPSSICH